MKTYIHNPIEVEALKWTGTNVEEMNIFLKNIDVTVFKNYPFYIKTDNNLFDKVIVGEYVVRDNFARYSKMSTIKFSTNFKLKE